MAGEIEDCISFEADCLHSGSISFGKFDAESLSWERRSSFSHNRYLEEVEKYSTPGSVTQKKAYFEAHFKKKALDHLATLEGQNGIEDQMAENEAEAQMNCIEEFHYHGNEGCQFEDFEDHSNEGIPFEEFEGHGSKPIQFEVFEDHCREGIHSQEYDDRDNEGIQCTWYDEIQVVSDELQHEVMECEREATSPYELPKSNEESESESDINCEQRIQTQYEHIIPSVKDDTPMIVEQKLQNDAENADGILEKKDNSTKSGMIEKGHVSPLKRIQKASPNLRTAVEKSTKGKLKTQAPSVQIPPKSSTEKSYLYPGKPLAKSSRRTERELPLKTKSDKQQHSKAPPTACTISRITKVEDSENVKAKARLERNSEKGLKAKKGGISLQSTPGMGEIDVRQSSNRSKRVTSSVKPELKESSVVFSLKSDERAEKRKEFYMKLEEKMHAKEAEMNEIQVRTQEETEAKIKQFRKSLNFKATPMPSFYHEAAPRGSDIKKVIFPRAKSPMLQSKCRSPQSRAVPLDNSSEMSKLANPADPSTTEPSSTSQQDPLISSEVDTGGQTLARGTDKTDSVRNGKQISQSSQSGKKEEKNRVNLQKQEGESKLMKGEKIRNVQSGMRKLGMAGGSKAVHVAS